MSAQDDSPPAVSGHPPASTPGGEVASPGIWDDDLRERLAAVEHARWAHWQQYLHSKCEPTEDGSLLIPADLVARWTRQIHVAYEDLSEPEKTSDREQVQHYLDVIAEHLGEEEATGPPLAGDR